MATAPKDGKLIYHLTSIENLESIFRNGLLSRDGVHDFTDVADKQIIDLRQEKGLNNLVPFHFFAANPFDGAVQLAYPDKKFVFITIARTYARRNGFKVLTRHPLSLEDLTLLSYEDGINQIDWDKMSERNYSDSECKEICMAECLSDRAIGARDFFSISVKDEEDKRIVEDLRDRTVGKIGTFYVNVQEYNFKR